MIIFDLDGTLADIHHRLHYIQDPVDKCHHCYEALTKFTCDPEHQCPQCKSFPAKWKADWTKFYKECINDKPIKETIEVLWKFDPFRHKVGIWSGRCESVRKQTKKWLNDFVYLGNFIAVEQVDLRMRPEGDRTPDEILKERWLDEVLNNKDEIGFVYDDNPKSIEMWRRRSIFVYDCNQTDEEF